MFNFFVQFSFIFIIAVLQTSFFGVFSSEVPLYVLLATAIAMTVTRGFTLSWVWVVFLGLMFDMISMNIIGITSIVLLMFSYVANFLSRHFLVDHRESGMIIAALFMVLFSIPYPVVLSFMQNITYNHTVGAHGVGSSFFQAHFFVALILNGLLFCVMYAAVIKINRILDFNDNRVKVRR